MKVPFCRVYTNWKDSYGAAVCVDGKAVTAAGKTHDPLGIANVICAGVAPARAGATSFRQLRCNWHGNNSDGTSGTLAIYVTGPSTFRWKSL